MLEGVNLVDKGVKSYISGPKVPLGIRLVPHHEDDCRWYPWVMKEVFRAYAYGLQRLEVLERECTTMENHIRELRNSLERLIEEGSTCNATRIEWKDVGDKGYGLIER
ncbi:unnamed protein product [Dovyalis caffra]|uniref:Uncharacterized protein n=1 Tax=Dovyalis caffra TaxID=77055 RepID=A0AAV1RPH0_9ROSI|nr:unnamed protein product [Dovyalis caffra]